ncbi:MAG: hypothetical protein JSV97_08600 [candidate division WOR-3 bacterium]|nr:MAG: hypothetical protein JSV97_08600 [candidate division WOR-3 bacterium]
MVVALVYFFITNQISESDTIFSALDSVYYHYDVMYDTTSFETLFISSIVDTTERKADGLRISGTKDFSFDLNQGFDQGLKVDVTGEVEGVRIEGNLSDKTTPSSTVQISEVEKMRLMVYTKNVYAGLGNLTVDLPFGIQDEIQGGRVGLLSSSGENEINLSYAINRGAFKRIRFTGEEGKQSPYFLEEGVIFGSERVYLAQGAEPLVLLMRDEDYTIDYEMGVVSFTNKHIITNYSRIEIEYQQSIEHYPNVYSEVDGQMKIGGLVLRSMYRRQIDDKEDPFTFSLSAAEIESLRQAGDSATVLHTYADTSSQGSYTLTDGHFEYVGEGLGEYNVTFFYVGENKGEYVYDPNTNAFSYRGTGLGNYSPTKFIPLPHKDEFYGVGADIFGIIDLTVYGSNFDNNTFSPFNDEDNQGLGLRVKGDKTVGFLSVSGEYISYEKTFLMPRGREEVDYQFTWNTDEPLEEMGIVSLGVHPAEFFTMNLGYGILNRQHKRKFVYVRPLFFTLGYEGIDSINKYFAAFAKKQDMFSVHSRYEYYRSSHLFNYGIQYFVAKNIAVGVSGSYNKDTTNRGITTVFDLSTPPLSLSLGHRLYNDTTFLYGNAIMNVRYKDLTLTGNLQQSQRYSQKRDEAYVEVEEGKGNYVYDPVTGTYIEKEGGNYVRKIFLLQDFTRVITRNYTIEAGYATTLFDFRGRFSYIDEEDFLANSGDIFLSVGDDLYELEFNVRQDIVEDERYALVATSDRERLFSMVPSYRTATGRFEIKERVEKYGEWERERRNSISGEIGYDLLSRPLVRPKIGYGYSTIFSQYFEELDIRLRTPRTSLLFELPVKKKGRLTLIGELIYRMYNIEDVPYFFSATEPPGLTKILNVTASVGLGVNTILSLIYRVEFPPEEKINQNVRFQTRIRF